MMSQAATPDTHSNFKENLKGLKEYGMIIALVVIYAIFAFMSDFKNVSPMNVNNLIMQNSYVIVLALGMLLCCLTGNVDLSVGSVVAFSGAIAAIMVVDYQMAIPLAILAAIGIGLLVGVWQGFFISKLEPKKYSMSLPVNTALSYSSSLGAIIITTF